MDNHVFACCGPTNEHRVKELIVSQIDGLFDEVTTDPRGSQLCKRRADREGAPKVMLLCHMDEIGFPVCHISNEGYLYMPPVSGIDPRNLFLRRALVGTPRKMLPPRMEKALPVVSACACGGRG